MLKIILRIILVGLIGCVSTVALKAQQNLLIQNQQISQSEPRQSNAFYIDGVSSDSDIGGVECYATEFGNSRPWSTITFENYNTYPVSVIYQVESENGIETGRIVLNANETKETKSGYKYPRDIKAIARPMSNQKNSDNNNYQLSSQNNNNNSNSSTNANPQASFGSLAKAHNSTIAVFDNSALQNWKAIKRVENQMNETANYYVQQFNEYQAMFDRLFQEYQNTQNASLVDEISKMNIKINEFTDSATRSMDELRQNLMRPLMTRLQEALGHIRKEKGYQYILDKSALTDQYNPNYVDITNLLIRYLNDNYSYE